jgi:hypothetical protein
LPFRSSLAGQVVRRSRPIAIRSDLPILVTIRYCSTPPPPQSYPVARNFTAAAVGSPFPSLLRCGQWFKEPPVNVSNASLFSVSSSRKFSDPRCSRCLPGSSRVQTPSRPHRRRSPSSRLMADFRCCEPLQPSGLLCLVAGDRLHAVRVLLCSESYRGKSSPWVCSFALPLNLIIIFCLLPYASLCWPPPFDVGEQLGRLRRCCLSGLRMLLSLAFTSRTHHHVHVNKRPASRCYFFHRLDTSVMHA